MNDIPLPKPNQKTIVDNCPTFFDSASDNDQEIITSDIFESMTRYETCPVASNVRIREEDLTHLTLHDLDKKILISELADQDMYLKNIHKGFKFARSVHSLIALVDLGIKVHRRRREVLKEVSNKQGAIVEMDEHGNVKTS